MELAAPNDPFDIVLASDCLYDSAMLAGFRKALSATCGHQTVLLMAYKRRLDRYPLSATVKQNRPNFEILDDRPDAFLET